MLPFTAGTSNAGLHGREKPIWTITTFRAVFGRCVAKMGLW